HAVELRDYLIEYETGRKRYVRAHALALEAPGFDPKELHELAEKAAKQALDMAEKEKRRDLRMAILQSVAQRYADTESGRKAAERVREEIEHASEQRVRISRGFLLENPDVAGQDGIGLRPELLDGDLRNGELHPKGVTMLGGRTIEVALVAEGKKESAE